MNRTKISTFWLLFSLALISSCCENGASPNSTSSSGGGSISGKVILFDSEGAVLTDYSGVQVSIDGTSRLFITDSSGEWQFAGLSNGMYDVTATKPGFGAYHWYEEPINTGHTESATIALAEMPNYAPLLGSVLYGTTPDDSSAPFYYVNVVGSFPQLKGGVTIVGYCDLDSMVEPGDPHLVISSLPIGTTVNNGNDLVINASDLFAAGVRPGQTLYFSAANVFEKQFFSTTYVTTFVDPFHNSEVRYGSNGPKSNAIAFTMR